jgi:WD40 repeat protein
MFGQIFVWKLTVRSKASGYHNQGGYGDKDDFKSTKNTKSKRKLIHSYNGHTKKVTSLCTHPINTMFISASLDNTVRIWCLDKFTELYCFNLIAGLTNIKLLNDKLFA